MLGATISENFTQDGLPSHLISSVYRGLRPAIERDLDLPKNHLLGMLCSNVASMLLDGTCCRHYYVLDCQWRGSLREMLSEMPMHMSNTPQK